MMNRKVAWEWVRDDTGFWRLAVSLRLGVSRKDNWAWFQKSELGTGHHDLVECRYYSHGNRLYRFTEPRVLLTYCQERVNV